LHSLQGQNFFPQPQKQNFSFFSFLFKNKKLKKQNKKPISSLFIIIKPEIITNHYQNFKIQTHKSKPKINRKPKPNLHQTFIIINKTESLSLNHTNHQSRTTININPEHKSEILSQIQNPKISIIHRDPDQIRNQNE
jgi:hypothetical protein